MLLLRLIVFYCLTTFMLIFDGVNQPKQLSGNTYKNPPDSLLRFYDIKMLEDSTLDALKNLGFTRIKRLTTLMIDPEDDVTFDKNRVSKKIKKYFPEENDLGYLIINWERKMFHDLKGRNEIKYNNAINQLTGLIKYIKKIRANVLIGVYGIPFRQNTIRNSNSHYPTKKIMPVLELVDFIAPSLYILYSDKENTNKDNIKYLQINLERALKFGYALNKIVIPYLGYRYYSKYSIDSWKLIPPQEFKSYVEFIMKNNYRGKTIGGFIIWNGDFSDYRVSRNSYKDSKLSKEVFLQEYNILALHYCRIVGQIVKK